MRHANIMSIVRKIRRKPGGAGVGPADTPGAVTGHLSEKKMATAVEEGLGKVVGRRGERGLVVEIRERKYPCRVMGSGFYRIGEVVEVRREGFGYRLEDWKRTKGRRA